MHLVKREDGRPSLSIVKERQYYKGMNDAELIAACQKRDRTAFEELIVRHQRAVHGILRQLAPDWIDHCDLAQEVYIRLWRSIHTLRNPNCFRTWLHQIVVNIFYDQLRKRPKQAVLSLEAPVHFENGEDEYTREVPDLTRMPDEMLQRKELAATIDKAVSKLPEQFRTAIVLRDVEGLSYEEIASITKAEVGTVKSRISRARGRVQAIVTHKYKDCA